VVTKRFIDFHGFVIYFCTPNSCANKYEISTLQSVKNADGLILFKQL